MSMEKENLKIGILTGLTAEARALGKPSDSFSVVTSAANITRGLSRLEDLINNGANVIGSIGVAGGIKHGFKPGQIILATEVIDCSSKSELPKDNDARAEESPNMIKFEADKAWFSKIENLFGEDLESGIILGVDKPISEPSAKRLLHESTTALSVDMESHIVAHLATKAGLPWFAIRIISDPVERRIPDAALAAIGSEREVSVARVLWGLLRRPTDFPALMGVAGETSMAMRSLKRVGRDFRASIK